MSLRRAVKNLREELEEALADPATESAVNIKRWYDVWNSELETFNKHVKNAISAIEKAKPQVLNSIEIAEAHAELMISTAERLREALVVARKEHNS